MMMRKIEQNHKSKGSQDNVTKDTTTNCTKVDMSN